MTSFNGGESDESRLDRLERMIESNARAIEALSGKVEALSGEREVTRILHEEMICRLSSVSEFLHQRLSSQEVMLVKQSEVNSIVLGRLNAIEKRLNGLSEPQRGEWEGWLR
jgi:hypothetical protein